MKLCGFSTLWMYGENDVLFVEAEGERQRNSTEHANGDSQKEMLKKELELVKNGMSFKEAANTTTVSVTLLRKHCIENGVHSKVPVGRPCSRLFVPKKIIGKKTPQHVPFTRIHQAALQDVYSGMSERESASKHHLSFDSLNKCLHRDLVNPESAIAALHPELSTYAQTLEHLFEATPQEQQAVALWKARQAAMPRRKRKPVAVTEDQKEQAVERIRQGQSVLSIAAELGVSDVAVYIWCKKRGVVTAVAARCKKIARGITPELDQRIRAFLQQYPRATQNQMYAAFKDELSVHTLHRYRAEHKDIWPVQRNWMKCIVPVNSELKKGRKKKKDLRKKKKQKKNH